MVLGLEEEHCTSFNSSGYTYFVALKLSYILGEGNLLSLSTNILCQDEELWKHCWMGWVAVRDGLLKVWKRRDFSSRQ